MGGWAADLSVSRATIYFESGALSVLVLARVVMCGNKWSSNDEKIDRFQLGSAIGRTLILGGESGVPSRSGSEQNWIHGMTALASEL